MKQLIVADLAAIEYRVVGWVSNCLAISDCIQKNRDPYLDFAIRLFPKKNLVYEDLWDKYNKKDTATDELRQLAKPPVLGGGYGLGGGQIIVNEFGDEIRSGLWGYALNVCGVDMPQELAHEAVKIYRTVNYEVVQFWKDMEMAFKWVLKFGGTVTVGDVNWDRHAQTWLPNNENFTGAKIKFSRVKTENLGYMIRMHLPSGRCLHYLNAKVEPETVIGNDGKPWTRDVIYYEGVEHSATTDDEGALVKKQHKWGQTKTYGGKLTENAVQAIARDVLVNGAHLAEEMNFKIWGLFHDEVATEVESSWDSPTLEDLVYCMSRPPAWATTMILDAAGYVSKYYRKG